MTLTFRLWKPFGLAGSCQRRSRLQRMMSLRFSVLINSRQGQSGFVAVWNTAQLSSTCKCLFRPQCILRLRKLLAACTHTASTGRVQHLTHPIHLHGIQLHKQYKNGSKELYKQCTANAAHEFHVHYTCLELDTITNAAYIIPPLYQGLRPEFDAALVLISASEQQITAVTRNQWSDFKCCNCTFKSTQWICWQTK